MLTLLEKIEIAKRYLGNKWVLAQHSTYDAKKREQGIMCHTLRLVVLKAMAEGRL